MGNLDNFVDQAGVTRLRASGGGGGSQPAVTDGATTIPEAASIHFPAGTVSDLGSGEAAVDVVGFDQYGAVSITRLDNGGPALDVSSAATKDDYTQIMNVLNGGGDAVLQSSSDGSTTFLLYQTDSQLIVRDPNGNALLRIDGDGTVTIARSSDGKTVFRIAADGTVEAGDVDGTEQTLYVDPDDGTVTVKKGANPVFQIQDADGSVHILAGTAIVADL